MAYGLKYWNEFSSEDNQLYRLEILADAYTGLTNKIDLDANPVMIRRGQQNQNKYAAILGSSLTFNVIGETPLQWIEFFTSNDKAYRVDLYKNGSIYWTGYVQTDIYTEPYRKGRYVVQVTANDGFANLKDVVYDASLMTTVNGGYNITIDEWLRKNLEAMEIFNFKTPDFYLYEAVDLELDNATVNTSPLTYLHIGSTAKDGEKVYDILQGLIDSFTCRIFQKDAAIFILPIDSIYAEEIIYRYRVDDAGGLDPVYTEVTINNLKRVGRELIWVNDDQMIEIVPAFREVSITNNAIIDLVVNEPMSDDYWDNSTTLSNWTKVGNYSTEQITDELSKDNKSYLKTLQTSSDSSNSGNIYTLKRCGTGAYLRLNFSFEYYIDCDTDFEFDEPSGRMWHRFSVNIPVGAKDLRSFIRASISGNNFFNGFGDIDDFDTYQITYIEVTSTSQLNKWQTETYEFGIFRSDLFLNPNFNSREYLDVYLELRPFDAYLYETRVNNINYRNLKLDISSEMNNPILTHTETNSNILYNEILNKTIMFDSKQFISDLTGINAFRMQFYNDSAKLAYKNDDANFIDPDGFKINGTFDPENYLSTLVSSRIYNNYENPSIKINGSIRGDLHLDSVVRDLNFPMKKFMVNFIEENLKAGVKQVEIIEIAEPL